MLKIHHPIILLGNLEDDKYNVIRGKKLSFQMTINPEHYVGDQSA